MKINKCQLASLKHEGKTPSKTGLAITSDFLKGNITSKEAINIIINYHLKGFLK
jgi:hypothetical protein